MITKKMKAIFWIICCCAVISEASTLRDTIWLQINDDQDVFFHHEVKKQETIYSISKKYDKTVEDLLSFNQLENSDIALGDSIQVPVATPELHKACELTDFRPKSKSPLICYKVKAGDNLFHLTHRVFDMDVKCLLGESESLISPLAEGQVLNLGYWQKSSRFRSSEKRNDSMLSFPNELEEEYWNKGEGKEVKQLVGAGAVQNGTNNQPLFVLFDDAEIGSIVKLYHKISEKTVYCRVVGTIPAKMRAQNIIIVTELVKKTLGLKEDRFNVAIEYFN